MMGKTNIPTKLAAAMAGTALVGLAMPALGQNLDVSPARLLNAYNASSFPIFVCVSIPSEVYPSSSMYRLWIVVSIH